MAAKHVPYPVGSPQHTYRARLAFFALPLVQEPITEPDAYELRLFTLYAEGLLTLKQVTSRLNQWHIS